MRDEIKNNLDESLEEIETDEYTIEELEPKPIPIPKPVPDFYCLRYGPVSGTYRGDMAKPNAGAYHLELRVDVDQCHRYAPVLKKVSGDLYQVMTWGPFKWYKYLQSWIVDTPTVSWSRCSVVITGNVRYWKGLHLLTRVRVNIPWLGRRIGPATVTFSSYSRHYSTYICAKKSNYFRDVKLEVDVCQSQNNPPVLPSYDTHAHPNRPPDLPQRTLTVDESYRESGVRMTIDPSHSIIDDSSNPSWSDAELHDAMETYFSRYAATKSWNYWVLLASRYDISTVAGIMFDYSVKAPDRQGSAVFKAHSWFNDLPAGLPANDAQAAALRDFLYCYVHEIGHGFNLLHSWQKSYATPPQPNRPHSLSWMNYPWKYDNLPGNTSGDFWANFRFMFDEEELIHIRHGDRNAVIFGGEPFAKGAALSEIPDLTGDIPLDVIVRGKTEFDYLEPIILELKIKNQTETQAPVVKELNPEYGAIKLHIECPDGTTLEYRPLMCKLAETETVEVPPGESHYQNIMVNYGKHGHYFKAPGLYRVQAIYQGEGNVLITSRIHQFIVGVPLSREEESAASRFYTREAGMALYLGGSDSPFLKGGMDTLRDVADEFKETPVGAQLSVVLAENLTRPFYRLEEDRRTLIREADPKKAIELINLAVSQHEANRERTLQNITYHKAIRIKSNMLLALNETDKAREELSGLVEYLDRKGVKKPVLNRIEDYSKTI